MRTLTLPGTTLTLSGLCLGTSNFGNGIPDVDAFRLLDLFRNEGGSCVDTASVYADWLPGEKSSSEKCIGRWLKQTRCRESMILATKGGHPWLESMHIPRLSPGEIVQDLESSLRNLGTDTLDLYWLHRDDPARPVAEMVETLASQVTAGKIRYFGCSNWRVTRIAEAQAYAAQQGIPGFVANQPLWSLATVDPARLSDPTMVAMDKDLHDFHRDTGLAAMPYSSQANGWFQKMAAPETAAVRAGQQGRYDNRENQARLQRVLQLATQTGLTITQIVLGYLGSQPFPTIPIVGCRTVAQLQDSLTAGEIQLSQDQIAFLAG